MNDASAWLSAIGNGLEFAGAALLVYEIVDDARAARRYLTRPQRVTFETAREYDTARPFRVRQTPEPPLEDRIRALEGLVEQERRNWRGLSGFPQAERRPVRCSA